MLMGAPFRGKGPRVRRDGVAAHPPPAGSTLGGPGADVLGVAFVVGVLAWSEISLAIMVVGFAVFAVLDGAVCLLGLAAGPRTWRLAAKGVAGVATGAFAFGCPDASRMALLYVLAIWVVVMGALRLRAAIDFGDRVTVRWVAATLALQLVQSEPTR
jgi:uncharacterized membrane protein HdeD (DUF308 family)